MALNYPGPFQVRIFYTVKSRPHQLNLNCAMSIEGEVGEPISNWIPIQKGGSAVATLQSHIDSLITDIKAHFNTGDTNFVTAELWKFTPLTFDAQFQTSYTIGVAGGAALATQDASEVIFTFRSAEGGIMKVYLEDTAVPQGQPVRPPYAGSLLATADELHGDTKIWLARDTSYPVSRIGIYPGQNEAGFKKIYRQ